MQDLKPLIVMRADGRQSWQGALVAFDGNNTLGALSEQRTGQATRSRTDFDNRHALQIAARPRDFSCQV